MARTFKVEIGTPGPASGNTEIEPWIAVWREAAAHFGANAPPRLLVDHEPDRWYHVTIDVSDVVDVFETDLALRNGDEVLVHERWAKREALGEHPLGAHLLVTLAPAGGHDSEGSLHVLGRFIQHWFLAMNLALPGCCTTFRPRLPLEADPDPLPPDLSGSFLENAYEHSLKRGWPQLRQLPLLQMWDWLQAELLYDTHIAKDPLDRALFTVLRVCEPELQDTDRILLIAQALEGLLSPGKEQVGNLLRQRLEVVLGPAPGKKNWFARFYDLRSRIAHGDYPLLRPGQFVGRDLPPVGEYTATFWEPTDQATAVLLALLQDLAAANVRQYSFEQIVHRS